MAKEQKPEKNKEYEILYFVSIALNPDELKSIKKKVNDIVTKYNGLILKEEEVGKHKLAYMVKRARHGYYLLTLFSADPSQISKINHEIQLLPEILRHSLSVKEDIKKPRITLDKTAFPEEKPLKKVDKQEEDKKMEKVDIQELDRKIDELLGEPDI